MGSGDKCSKGYRLNCSHSIEAILMLLSHAPQRFSIKEIADVTQFHRNTIRPALKDHINEDDPENGLIKFMGEGNYRVYYYETVSDHYRSIVKTINDLEISGVSQEMKSSIIRQMGYKFVEQKLNKIMQVVEGVGNKFEHRSLIEALVHIKMGYPFNDLRHVTHENGTEVCPTIAFSINEPLSEIDPSNFDLNIHPCLCEGKPEQSYACDFAAGTLEGTIKGTLRIDASVTKTKSGQESQYGPYCTYNIQSSFSSTDRIKQDVPIIQ